MNQLILGDCLEVMRKMDTESIDLIYLDPPFFSNRNYEVIWGDKGEVRSFEDRWSGAKYDYDAWGRMRDPNTLEYINNYLNPQLTIIPRGYTGHEHLESFAIINMNGRIYDPAIGRFFSPDNYIQQPDNPQSYNRYSYCINNPLKYTDPSGEVFGIDDFIIAATISALVSASTQAVLTGTVNWTNVGVSAITAGLTAGFGGIPGILPGAAYGAASNVLANGIANVIMGNKFGDNWLSSAISGAIFGGIKGGIQAANQGKNLWWGTDIGKNRSQWSFWNTDIPDYQLTLHQYDVLTPDPNWPNANQLLIKASIKVNDPTKYSKVVPVQTIDRVGLNDITGEIRRIDTYPDVLEGAISPFYYPENSIIYQQNNEAYKATSSILDAPSALDFRTPTPINIPNTHWRATTSFMGLTTSGNWERITTFSWGYQILQHGQFLSLPFLENISPGIGHNALLPR